MPGRSTAEVTSSSWRVQGNKIIIEFMVNNPDTDTVTVRYFFKSKSRPGFSFEPRTVTRAVGAVAASGPRSIIWDYQADIPQGLPKDEYYFDFQTSSARLLAAPQGTVLFTVVTKNQTFVIACPQTPIPGGLLVVKGAAIRTRPCQVLTGYRLLGCYSSNHGVLTNEDVEKVMIKEETVASMRYDCATLTGWLDVIKSSQSCVIFVRNTDSAIKVIGATYSCF